MYKMIGLPARIYENTIIGRRLFCTRHIESVPPSPLPSPPQKNGNNQLRFFSPKLEWKVCKNFRDPSRGFQDV